MKIDLSGKTALVTGSTSGIGHAIARGLDLKAIQDILGHEWLSTTTRYIHVHDAHIENAWAAANTRVAGRLELPGE